MPNTSVKKKLLEADQSRLFSPDDVEHPIAKAAVAYWNSVRGARKFPARSDLSLRGMSRFISYSLIVAVLEDGADYQYKFVGDIERQQFNRDFKGVCISDVEKMEPAFGRILRKTYDGVRLTGAPMAVRGLVDHAPHDAWLPYHESVFLPLGATDEAVDHLLIVGVNIPRPEA
ncbi:MAG TPA: hypothetical protein VMJ73_01500 [Rhizomicrobium sp.]|jgi:hypothetical protein|nr:hypothetical protein [Rhizomicrobium sp.]